MSSNTASRAVDPWNVRTWPGLIALVLIIATAIVTWLPGAAAQEEIHRTLWIPRSALTSRDGIERALSSAVTARVDTVVVPLSPASDYAAAFDPITEVLQQAAARNVRVYGDVSVNLVAPAGVLPAARDHVIYQHPEWLMVPRELATELLTLDMRGPDYVGRLARWTRAQGSRVDGLYLSPLHVDAATYLAETIGALVRRYALDGVHLGSLTYPGDNFDYSRRAMDALRRELRPALTPVERLRMDAVEAIDPFAYAEEFPEEWRRFRQWKLTALTTRIRTTVKSVRPGTMISAAVSSDVESAGRAYFQDWRTWMDNGFIDALSRRDGSQGLLFFTSDSLLRAPVDFRAIVPPPPAPAATPRAGAAGS